MLFSQTSFYIFVDQIVCVDAKCTCLTHSMLHMMVIINDILQCSTCERVRLTFQKFSDYVVCIICTFGNFYHVFTRESVDYFTFTYTFL